MGLLDAERTVTRLRKDQYVRKKNEVLNDWRSMRVWFSPDRGRIETIILLMMGKSRRRVTKYIEHYKFGSWTFTEYCFGRKQAIHVEQNVKQDLATIRFNNIDTWTRFHIMRELLMQEKKLVYTVESYIAKLDSLYIVSRLWMQFITENVEISVGRWMVVQPEMKRLIQYRNVHVTRDDLRLVQEVTIL